MVGRPQEGWAAWANSVAVQTVVGVFAVVTLPWVARGLAALHLAIGRLLFSPRTTSSLSEKIHTLDIASHAAAAAETGALRRLERDVHDGPVEKHVTSIFSKLNLAPAHDDHRRVLAVLTFLGASPRL